MNRIYLYLILICTSFLFFSCVENESKPEKKQILEQTYEYNLNEYYSIIINNSQINQLNRIRILTLTKNQSRKLKNKVHKFKVSEPVNPEGWFGAYWYKPNEVLVSKQSIDAYEDLLDHKFKDTISNNKNRTINIFIGVDGNFYYKGTKRKIMNIITDLKRINVAHKNEILDVIIHNAPIENAQLKEKVKKDEEAINSFLRKVRKEYFKNKK